MPGPASLAQVQEIMRANGGGGIGGSIGQAGGPLAQWNPNDLPGPASLGITENQGVGGTGGIGGYSGPGAGYAPAQYAQALAAMGMGGRTKPMMGRMQNPLTSLGKIGKTEADDLTTGVGLSGIGGGLGSLFSWLGNNAGSLLSNLPLLYGLGREISNPNGMNMGQVINFGREAANVADPFASQRQQYQQQLQQLMTNPDSIQNTPGYQFRMDQGINAIDRAAAAKGMLGSGNRMYDLTNYAQGLASQEYDNQINRLMNLSGATTGSPAAAAQSMMEGLRTGYGMEQQRYNDIGAGLQGLLGSGNQGNLLGMLSSLLGGGGSSGGGGNQNGMLNALSRIFGGGGMSESDILSNLWNMSDFSDNMWMNGMSNQAFDAAQMQRVLDSIDWGNFDWSSIGNWADTNWGDIGGWVFG